MPCLLSVPVLNSPTPGARISPLPALLGDWPCPARLCRDRTAAMLSANFSVPRGLAAAARRCRSPLNGSGPPRPPPVQGSAPAASPAPAPAALGGRWRPPGPAGRGGEGRWPLPPRRSAGGGRGQRCRDRLRARAPQRSGRPRPWPGCEMAAGGSRAVLGLWLLAAGLYGAVATGRSPSCHEVRTAFQLRQIGPLKLVPDVPTAGQYRGTRGWPLRDGRAAGPGTGLASAGIPQGPRCPAGSGDGS